MRSTTEIIHDLQNSYSDFSLAWNICKHQYGLDFESLTIYFRGVFIDSLLQEPGCIPSLELWNGESAEMPFQCAEAEILLAQVKERQAQQMSRYRKAAINGGPTQQF